MTGLFGKIRRTALMMIGIPDYDGYVGHMRAHHPDAPVMSRTQFFRERQEARYGGGSARCC